MPAQVLTCQRSRYMRKECPSRLNRIDWRKADRSTNHPVSWVNESQNTCVPAPISNDNGTANQGWTSLRQAGSSAWRCGAGNRLTSGSASERKINHHTQPTGREKMKHPRTECVSLSTSYLSRQ